MQDCFRWSLPFKSIREHCLVLPIQTEWHSGLPQKNRDFFDLMNKMPTDIKVLGTRNSRIMT